MQEALERALGRAAGGGERLLQDRDGRDRHRPDAPERRRHVRHPEAPRRVAESPQAEARSGAPARGDRAAHARQQLRVHAAHPDALQRADRRGARRRRGQGLRRRHGSAPRERRARSPRCCAAIDGASDVTRRAGDGAAGADHRDRPPGHRALRARSWPTCRTSSRSPSAARRPGLVFEGDRRFELVVRLPGGAARAARTRSKRLPIPLPCPATGVGACRRADRASCRSANVARFEVLTGPNQISRENGKRRVVVTANVRGRDLGSFVEEAERRDRGRGDDPAGLLDRHGAASSSSCSSARTPAARRRPAGAAAHPRAALRQLRCAEGLAARLHGRAAGAHRRRARALAARHPVLDLGGGRLHRALGRRGAQRPRHDHVHERAARPGQHARRRRRPRARSRGCGPS